MKNTEIDRLRETLKQAAQENEDMAEELARLRERLGES